MSLEAVIKLIFFYKLEGVALDLRAYSLKAYYKDNKDTLLIISQTKTNTKFAKLQSNQFREDKNVICPYVTSYSK